MTTRVSQGRRKGIEEVVSYALSHRIRIQILLLLNEAAYTSAQLAQIIGEPLNNVSNHVRQLAEAGSIEIVKTEHKKNIRQHYYRAIQLPFYTDEEMESMTPELRQVTYGFVVQSALAEVMAALWAGKLRDDPRVWLTWRWFLVDDEGRQAIADEQQKFWDRMKEIEAESVNRRATSKAKLESIIVTQFGYERARRASEVPAHSANGERRRPRD